VVTADAEILPGIIASSHMCLCRRQLRAYTCSLLDLSCDTLIEPHTFLHADAKTLPGISDPFPDLFDPANLLARADGSVRPVQEVKRWREAEITHGRVSMLAALVRTLLINAAGSLKGQ